MDATNGTDAATASPVAAAPPELERRGPRADAGEARSNPTLDRFWAAIRRVPRYLRLAANLARDERVPPTAKAALVVGGVYTVSPVDLVPGIIPVAGQLDDLIVLLVAIRTAVRACPAEVAEEHLARVGVRRDDFDGDLAAARDTALWVAGKGWRAARSLATRGGRRVQTLWRDRGTPSRLAPAENRPDDAL